MKRISLFPLLIIFLTYSLMSAQRDSYNDLISRMLIYNNNRAFTICLSHAPSIPEEIINLFQTRCHLTYMN